jgi:hypothetical protein
MTLCDVAHQQIMGQQPHSYLQCLNIRVFPDQSIIAMTIANSLLLFHISHVQLSFWLPIFVLPQGFNIEFTLASTSLAISLHTEALAPTTHSTSNKHTQLQKVLSAQLETPTRPATRLLLFLFVPDLLCCLV